MHGELLNYAHVQCVCVWGGGPQLSVFISSMAHSDECLMLTHFRVSMVTGGHWPRVVSERQAHSSSYTATCEIAGANFLNFFCIFFFFFWLCGAISFRLS